MSHEMIGRMLLKNLAGLDRLGALKLSHPWDVVYKVHPALGTIELLTPAVPQPRSLGMIGLRSQQKG